MEQNDVVSLGGVLLVRKEWKKFSEKNVFHEKPFFQFSVYLVLRKMSFYRFFFHILWKTTVFVFLEKIRKPEVLVFHEIWKLKNAYFPSNQTDEKLEKEFSIKILFLGNPLFTLFRGTK